MANYRFEPVSDSEAEAWDQLIEQCQNSTAFQTWTWRSALATAFKQLTPHYFWIKSTNEQTSQSELVGGLPTFIFQPMPTVKMLYSLPWNLFGGFFLLPDTGVDHSQLYRDLHQHLRHIITTEKICQITFVPDWTQDLGTDLIQNAYREETGHFTHLLNTGTDYNLLWSAYNKRVRGAVRKAEKTGVKVYDTTEQVDLNQFYQIYLQTQQRLDGTPKPFALISQLFESDLAKLAIAKHEGKVIAGLLYLFFNQTVTLWAGASDPQFWEFRPNNAIFHHIIRWACTSGYSWVDFGASPPDNIGLIKHKEEYRAVPYYFNSYTKVEMPLQVALWEKSEPTLRKVYAFLQHIGN